MNINEKINRRAELVGNRNVILDAIKDNDKKIAELESKKYKIIEKIIEVRGKNEYFKGFNEFMLKEKQLSINN